MEIKNQLVGEEHEAVELYPAKKRIVDTEISSIYGVLKIQKGFSHLDLSMAIKWIKKFKPDLVILNKESSKE